VQRAVERKDDVVAKAEIEGELLRHPPVVLRVELVLPEPRAPFLVLSPFVVVLKVAEQRVRHDIAGRVPRRGGERHHAVFARPRVLVLLTVGRLRADLEQVRTGNLAEIVAELIRQVPVPDVIPRVVAGESAQRHVGPGVEAVRAVDFRKRQAAPPPPGAAGRAPASFFFWHATTPGVLSSVFDTVVWTVPTVVQPGRGRVPGT